MFNLNDVIVAAIESEILKKQPPGYAIPRPAAPVLPLTPRIVVKLNTDDECVTFRGRVIHSSFGVIRDDLIVEYDKSYGGLKDLHRRVIGVKDVLELKSLISDFEEDGFEPKVLISAEARETSGIPEVFEIEKLPPVVLVPRVHEYLLDN